MRGKSVNALVQSVYGVQPQAVARIDSDKLIDACQVAFDPLNGIRFF